MKLLFVILFASLLVSTVGPEPRILCTNAEYATDASDSALEFWNVELEPALYNSCIEIQEGTIKTYK